MNDMAAIPAVGDEPADTMMRGSKMRIYPSARQAATMDLWRRRYIQLWNLLLELEQAAYSGENRRTQIGWRSIWRQVVEDSHAEAVRVAREGKKRKDGTFRKEPSGKEIPPRVRVGRGCRNTPAKSLTLAAPGALTTPPAAA